jgi:hypothetical protein
MRSSRVTPLVPTIDGLPERQAIGESEQLCGAGDSGG